MKRGYYLFVENCGSSGVMKKIEMQIKAFSRHLLIEPIQINNINVSVLKRIYNMFPWASFERDYGGALSMMKNPDFVYIRRTFVDKRYLLFLKEIKERWPDCKVIVELMVYPYEKDMLSHPYTAFCYIKELIYRKKYRDNIDRFVTYSDDDVINGVKTIKTMNGIDVSSFDAVKNSNLYNPGNINLIGVATFIKHHGYERVIEGIHKYYESGGTRRIKLHLVGDGPEKGHYLNLIDKYNLNNDVILYGAKYGKDLDEIYDKADAGLAAFGAYKDGVDKLCTIKAREYLAKGLPVVLGCEDNLFLNEAKEIGLIFDNDSSDVSIDRIIDFLDGLYRENGKGMVVDRIHQMAYELVDNDVTLRPILRYIEE